jgi:DMSO/TMAO reductase YedYZ heme-binding membrane subunit
MLKTRENWKKIYLVIYLITFLQVIASFFVPGNSASIFGNITLVTISLHLMMKSLSFVKYKKKNSFIEQIKIQKLFQREQGLIIFNLMMVHVVFGLRKTLPSFDINNLDKSNLSGFLPLIIMTFLLLTSYRFFQKKIKNWKKLHSVIWLMIPLIIVHAYISKGHLSVAMLISAAMLIVSLIASASYNQNVLKKRIILLVLGIFIGLISYFLIKAY